MNGYVKKLRQRFSHKMPHIPHYSPYRAHKRAYRSVANDTIPPYETATFDEKKIKPIQQVIGVCLYYNRIVDDTIPPDLSAITSEQTEANRRTTEENM